MLRCIPGQDQEIKEEGSGLPDDKNDIINADVIETMDEKAENIEMHHVRDPAMFPACVTDEDCHSTGNEDFKCFQYMCYPWARTDWKKPPPFRSCKKRSHSQRLTFFLL